MKNKLFILTVIILALFVTCSKILESEDKEVKLSGTVKNYFTGENIVNAALTLTGESIEEVTSLSDSSGAFTLITEVEETSQLSLEISKESYYSKTMDIEVEPGKERKLGSLLLQPDYDSLTVSGQIVDGLYNEPVQDVQLITEITQQNVTTDEQGYFSFDIKANQSVSSTIVFQKQYFISDTVQVDIEPEQDVEIGKITMNYELDPAHLRGTVYNNRSDTTINRVKVSIEEYDKVYGYTDESGNFDLSVQINTAQAITVNFGKYPYDSKSIKVDPISPEDDLNLGKIKLVPPAYESLTVYGKVVKSDQQPLENAEIRCEILDEPVTTNASGQFEFDVKVDSIRTVELTASKQYFQDSSFSITLNPEQDYETGTIELAYQYDPAIITGQVFNDRADTTLNDIKVSIEGLDQVYTHTDSNGEFELPVQINTAQTINVVFSKYPYETKTITIDPISPKDEIDLDEIRLVPPAYKALTVSGKVIDSRENEPIENAEIMSEILESPVNTDSRGNFEIEIKVDSNRTVEFTISKQFFNDASFSVTLNPEEDYSAGSIELSYKYSQANITGQIYNSRSDTTVNRVKVSIEGIDDVYSYSDSDGNFSLPVQINTAQTINVNFSKYPYNSKTIEIDPISPEEEINLGKIEIIPPEYQSLTLRGKVIDNREGDPIENAEISGIILDSPIITDARGVFETDLVIDSAQTVDLTVRKQYFEDSNLSVNLSPEKDKTVDDIVLNYKYSQAVITGQIYNARSDTAIINAKASISGHSIFDYTDDNGNFEINIQINTDQTVTLQLSKYPYETKSINIDPISPEDELSLGKILLTPPEYQALSLSGKVIDSRISEPIADVEVYNDIMESAVITNSLGKFEFNLQIDADTSLDFSFSKEYFNDTTISNVSLSPQEDYNFNNVVMSYEYNKASISGQILDNRTGDPIEDAKILHSGTGQYTTSDASGNFSMDLQINEPQSVSLTISLDPYETKTYTIDNVTPEENITLDPINLIPPANEPLTVSGKVIDNRDNESLSGVEVYTDMMDSPVTTSSLGKFEFDLQIDADTSLDFSFSKDYFNDTTISNVSLSPEADHDFNNVVMSYEYNKASISGQILDNRTGDPIEDAKILHSGTGIFITSDASGNFSMDIQINEPQGVSLTISLDPYETKTYTIDNVTPEENVTLDPINLIPPAYEPLTVSGKVIDNRDNESLSGVEVYTDMMDSPVTTSSLGKFEFDLQIDADTSLEFTFSKEYFDDNTISNVSLSPQEDHNFSNVVMSYKYNKATISGQILDNRTGDPIEDAKILHSGTGQYTTSDAS
ncbi:MAG: hypothetical protein K9N00_02250, partial [Candidatus Marinimicrobia bacterium]|nr:hypothetical protein [Candidatus Neomarinimicrobiota bacterium]